MDGIKLTAISAKDTLPLRHLVLRQGMPEQTCQFPGDNHKDTVHLGAYANRQLIGIVSLYRTSYLGRTDTTEARDWQLRGMAVHPDWRGKGVGGLLLRAAKQLVVDRQGHVLWCNAREAASGFYARQGFVLVGEPFVIEPIGRHVRMVLALKDQVVSNEF